MSGYNGRNRSAANGGPRGVQRSYASSLQETEGLFNSYEHLQGLPRGDAALTMLRKIASQVKPIMRKRNWKVQVLSEFLPPEQNLLGLNINKGYKICLRLRYHNNPDLFLPIEEVVDTMLHELSHNVWGDHDSKFHALWEQLRDEHEVLVIKGYTGEGFLTEGHRLGGGRNGMPPPTEIRRLAQKSAEDRKQRGVLTKGSGQRLGGTPLHYGRDPRQVIAEQTTRRTVINRGCASGREDAGALSTNNTFQTKAEEDDANDRAITQALYELMEQEEEEKLKGTFEVQPPEGGLSWTSERGLYDAGQASNPTQKRQKTDTSPLNEEDQLRWAMEASMNGAASPAVSPMSPEPDPPTPPIPQRLRPSLPPHPSTRAPPRPQSISGQQLGTRQQPISLDDFDDASPPARSSKSPLVDISEPFNPDEWTCDICTCINPVQFLACDACATERPPPPKSTPVLPAFVPAHIARPPPPRPTESSYGWICTECTTIMENRWWTCSSCGAMKTSS